MAVLRLLGSRWKSDAWSRTKFATLIQSHADQDKKYGMTCRYNIWRDPRHQDSVSFDELQEMLPIIPNDFYDDEKPDSIGLNQHYQHSLEQFLAVAQHEWDQHIERTNALIGTPAGRIPMKGAP